MKRRESTIISRHLFAACLDELKHVFPALAVVDAYQYKDDRRRIVRQGGVHLIWYILNANIRDK